MKKLLFLFSIFYALTANAQTYLISFAGTGESSSVSTVKVENLMSGASLNINGNDILRLNVLTGVNSIDDKQSSGLKIYPNPMTDNSTLEIFPPVAGNAVITVYELTGKPIAQIQSNFENVRQDYKISGVKNGLYIIGVKGNNYQFSGILLSNSKSNGTINIEKVNNIIQSVDEKTTKKDSKGTQATVEMAYSTGDRLKLTGVSGIYSTVMTDVPVSDKTITFNFITCTDGDNNNYPVVEIGTQLWMAENLKSTKYSNGDLLATTTPATLDISWQSAPKYQWAYDGNENNVTTYGRLYTWFAVTDIRNVCPIGWHVPSDAEWTTLTTYLGGESVAGGKLKETGTTHWSSPNTGATNETGFTALPGGYRYTSPYGHNHLNGFSGSYNNFPNFGNFWYSTEYPTTSVWFRDIYNSFSNVFNNYDYKQTGCSVRCLQGVVIPELTITITQASSITQTSAISGGNVTSDGGETVTARGVCWKTSGNPTIADNHTLDGTGTGIFTSNLTGLTPNTKYYLRAYATNSAGTGYSNEIFFETRKGTGTVSDIDGNTYWTIEIGTQVWMTENLKTTRYNNGDIIGTTTPATLDISGESAPKYQWAYDGNESNVTTYGRLYTWHAVSDIRNVCPIGWHVPTDDEWTTLTTWLGGESVAGGKLKETGTTHWSSQNIGATNETGFTALPGGSRDYFGAYDGVGNHGTWWSSTEGSSGYAYSRYVGSDYRNVFRGSGNERSGHSVRCLQGMVLPDLSITTAEASLITQTSAVSGGIVPRDGGETITARGVCWNTSGNPTIADNHTLDGTGTGSFTSNLTGLTINTKYYVKAFATNSSGTGYSNNEIFFATRGKTGTVSDIDGNIYSTIEIGTQVWMAENLKTTSYRNSDLIGTTTPATLDISYESAPRYQWAYDGNESNVATYGRLYTWYTMTDSRKICPTGWHVPTHTEWSTLTTYLGVGLGVGGKLKETGTTHWSSPNTGATNETGFTALPGGYRVQGGTFYDIGNYGYWWSSTEASSLGAWDRSMAYNYSSVYNQEIRKLGGYSVRCVKD